MKHFIKTNYRKTLMLISILTFTAVFSVNAADYHVSISGDDGNDGSISNPWATLSHACNQATSTGDVIHLAEGTYDINSTCKVRPGVSIVGAGIDVTILNGNTGKPIRLKSPADEGDHCAGTIDYSNLTSGQGQEIAYFTMNNPGNKADEFIEIEWRKDVYLHHLKLNHSNNKGISLFVNTANIEISNVLVYECGHEATHSLGGITSQGYADNIHIHDCFVSNYERGYGIKFFGLWGSYADCETKYDAVVKDVLIENTTFRGKKMAQWGGGTPNFAIEFVNMTLQEAEVRNNDIGLAVSCVPGDRVLGDFSMWLHDNIIAPETWVIEIYSDHLIIDHNYIDMSNYSFGGAVPFTWYGTHDLQNLKIHHNIIYGEVGAIINSKYHKDGYTVDGLEFYNNSIYAVKGTYDLFQLGSSNTIDMRNNVIDCSDRGTADFTSGATLSGTFTNNVFNNINTSGKMSGTVNNNITAAPQWAGSGNKPAPYFVPNVGGNLENAGVDVGYAYQGATPDIGAYESDGSQGYDGGAPDENYPPMNPSSLSAIAEGEKVMLNWKNNPDGDLEGYNIYRSFTSGNGYTQLNSSLISTSEFTDTDVNIGETYFYVVTAVDDKDNTSGYSNEVSATPADIPGTPKGLQAIAANQVVALYWDDNPETDLAGYHVYRSAASGSNYTRITDSLADSSEYVDNAVSNGTTYYYMVEAVDKDGNASGYSDEVNATPEFKEVTYLSDISWFSIYEGYGNTQLDASIKENPLTIDGQEYDKGIGTHAHSEIVYKLAGVYNTFQSYIGIDDEVSSGGSCGFVVYVDGEEVYNSDVLTFEDSPVFVEVDVTGAYELMLVVNDGGNGIGADHANWADAKLLASSVAVTGISVSPTTLSIDEGRTGQLSETVSPSNATDKRVTWSSNNTSVATVDANGLVTGVSEGSATITVTTNDGEYTAMSNVTINVSASSNLYRAINVNGDPLTIDGIDFESGNDSDFTYNTDGGVYAGGATPVPAVGTDEEAMLKTFMWGKNMSATFSSVPSDDYSIYIYVYEDNTSVTKNASIKIEGNVVESGINTSEGEWIKYGPYNMSITDGTINFEFNSEEALNVSGFEIYSLTAVTGVSVSPTTLTLEEGQTGQLSETVSPSDATDKRVTWESDNTAIATVDANGLVTAVSEGSANITVTTNDGNFSTTCTIEVNATNTSISNAQKLIPDVLLYPNPASADRYVKMKIEDFTGSNVKVKIIDYSGKLIRVSQKNIVDKSPIHLDINNIIPGIYSIHIAGNKKYATKTLIIK